MRISDWSSDVCSSDLKAALAEFIAAQQVEGIVIGRPLNLDGSESPRSQSSRAFARNLADLGLPVLLWDERWSTQAVTRTLIDADASRARRSELVDKLAASYILQGAIDARSEEPTSELQSLMRISYAV